MDTKDLKCCGNCKHRKRQYYGTDYLERCGESGEPTGSDMICQKWEFDGQKKR